MSHINRSDHNMDDRGPQWTSVDPSLAFIVELSALDCSHRSPLLAVPNCTGPIGPLSPPTLIIQTFFTSCHFDLGTWAGMNFFSSDDIVQSKVC